MRVCVRIFSVGFGPGLDSMIDLQRSPILQSLLPKDSDCVPQTWFVELFISLIFMLCLNRIYLQVTYKMCFHQTFCSILHIPPMSLNFKRSYKDVTRAIIVK